MAFFTRCRCLVMSRILSVHALNVPVGLREPGFCYTLNALRLSTSTYPLLSQSTPPKVEDQRSKYGPISWKTLAISTAVIGGLLQMLWVVKEKKTKELDKEAVKSLGLAAIGGEFELVSHYNEVVRSKDFLGKWVLLYFGFTHCPDICPEELEKMSKVVDFIDGKEGKDVLQPIFISVDPERDSPSVIAKYVSEFSPRLLGLTGSVEQIKDVCHKYRIYFSMGPKEDNDYIVDHSIIMYLINPKGEFVDYFGQNKAVEEIFNNVHMHILKYSHQSK